MRHIIFTAWLLLAMNVQAQVPLWQVHPKYESIEMIENGLYIVSNNGKYGLLNDKEAEILPIKYDQIGPFKSHYALLFIEEKPVAYISDEGRIIDISDNRFEVVGQPFFHDGYLLVRNSIGYYYIHAEDDQIIGPFSGGSPFSEGYATVRVPKKLNHILDGDYTIRLYSAKTGKPEKLKLGEFDDNDVDFISAVSKGKVIIVLKKRFYEYDIQKETLTPLSTDGDLENKKSRVTANERPVLIITEENGFSVSFKQGSMTFDPRMRLNSITYTGKEEQKVDVPEEIIPEKTSPIKSIDYNGTELLGLSYNDTEILTAQFEKVTVTWNDKAVVMQNGKYGVIAVDPTQTYHFVLNDNMAIGFEHKTVITDIKVVCPPYMKPSLMTLSSEDENCTINIETRNEKTNVETAVLNYKCALNIPEEIGLERSSTSTKFSLNYDGLKLTPHLLTFDTWYINNYSVQILKHSIEGSVANADILVNNASSANKNFFRDVVIEAEDSVISNLTKVTEEMYAARFYGWKEGNLRFSVDITEDGCPTISYSFAIPISVSGKKNKPMEPERPVAQAKVKRKAKSATKKEEKKIFIPN